MKMAKKNSSTGDKQIMLGFTPHPGQQEMLDILTKAFSDFDLTREQKRFVLSFGRSWGKSMMIMNFFCWCAINFPNQKICYITPTFKLAKPLFNDLCDALEGSPVLKSINKTDLIITFFNNNQIVFGSSENANAWRGQNNWTVCCLDEAGFQNQEIWKVMEPALRIKGRMVIFISTPNGKNWFYNLYLRAKNGLKNWHSFQKPSWDSPLINREEIEQIKIHSPLEYKVEYCAEFVDESLSVFNIQPHNIHFEDKTYGVPQPGEQNLYFGIDLGKSIDKTVCICSSVVDNNIIIRDIFISNKKNWDEILPELEFFYNKWKPTYGFIESNFNDRIADELINQRNCKNLTPLFVDFTKKTKMIQNLQLLFAPKTQNNTSNYTLKIPEKPFDENVYNPINVLHTELGQYQAKYNSATGRVTHSAPAGMHDDTVSALLQCCYAILEKKPSDGPKMIWDSI